MDIWNKLSPSFVDHLNHCAKVIQVWYRNKMKKRKLLNDKKREILSSFESSSHITGENAVDLVTRKMSLKKKESKLKVNDYILLIFFN